MIKFAFADQSFQTDRIIGNLAGPAGSPIVVFVAGIHGNEPSGVIALQRVFGELASQQIKLSGGMIGLAGNLSALAENRRYISQDLNRMWDNAFSQQYRNAASPSGQIAESRERHEIFEVIEPLLQQFNLPTQNPQHVAPLYFVDLHTTSAPSVPFIAINDQLNNRKFALQFPVPTVLGIEEYLQGPLLSYLNDFGPVALAFEAGQHNDPNSIDVHASFIYLALLAAGVIRAEQIPNLANHQSRLQKCGGQQRGIFEVVARKPITADDGFVMDPNYSNFVPIKKGEVLARDRNGAISAERNGRIFMPLYQPVGEDGFFIVRKVPRWALSLSSVLRKINFETILTLLPGVSRSPHQPDALLVNKKVARFLANELFHLLGYRRKKDDGEVMIVSRREIET